MSILQHFRLDDQLALVTGCTRGIGQAMAVALAEAGADIIGVGSSLTDSSEVAVAVRERGRVFQAFRANLEEAESVARLCEDLKALPISIAVNNAGIIRRAPARDHQLEDWQSVLQVNLDAPWQIAQAVGAGMLDRGFGRVIFTASLLSFQGGITVPGYAASKGAIAQLTKALANEWTAQGVTVNAIAPGYIATDATQALREHVERSAAILGRIPAERWGEPEDIAGATVFLASRASGYVSGHVLVVDGGWMGR